MSFLPAIISLERLLFVSLREMYCARSSTRWHSWDGCLRSGACVISRELWCRISVPYLHLLFRSIDINRFCFMRFVNAKMDANVSPRHLAPIDFTYCLLLQSKSWPVPVMNDHSTIHITALAFTTVMHTRFVEKSCESWCNEKMKEQPFAFSHWILARGFSLLLAFHAPRTKPRLS